MRKHSGGYILVFLFVLCSFTASGQKALLRKADKLYEQKAYAEAIRYFSGALKKDGNNVDALIKIADCYRLVNNSSMAMKYYGRVVNLPQAQPIHIYYYAETLMKSGAYEEARNYLSRYKEDERGRTFEKAIAKINVFYKDSARYRVVPVPFDSKENDFSPVVLNDGKIVFATARERTQMISYIHAWTDRKYYAMYITEKKPSGKYKKPRLFARNLQNRYNDGPISFDRNEKTVFITRNIIQDNKAVKSSEGIVKLNIYQATYDSRKKRYSDIKGFEYNDENYNTAHPAVSPDGALLYFSSDMPGGKGGMDIWVSRKLGDGWSKPENMGDRVNTAGNEVFPYVFDKHTLYFSSDGFAGIGGLDIFSLKIRDDGTASDTAVNVGAPLNSPSDDFGVYIYPEGTEGFISSNRLNHDLNDDIFSFSLKAPEKKPYLVLVRDSVSKVLLASRIVFTDQQTNEMAELEENAGKYIIQMFPGHEYAFSAYSDKCLPKENLMYTAPPDSSVPYEILMKSNKYFVLGRVYKLQEDSSFSVLDGATVTVSDNKGKSVCLPLQTNETGTYISCDLTPGVPYKITAQKFGYLAKTFTFDALDVGGSLHDFFLAKEDFDVGKVFRLDNIYFDYDKWNIRPDAAAELDKVVTILKENPDIIIELSSHTDCRGDYDYNMELSEKRAKASAQYIISKGIRKERIISKGYGESLPVNECRCEDAVTSDCSEDQHQQNRRTEFKVLGYVKGKGNSK